MVAKHRGGVREMDEGGQKVKRKNIYIMNTEQQQQRKETVENRSNIQLKKHSNRTGIYLELNNSKI